MHVATRPDYHRRVCLPRQAGYPWTAIPRPDVAGVACFGDVGAGGPRQLSRWSATICSRLWSLRHLPREPSSGAPRRRVRFLVDAQLPVRLGPGCASWATMSSTPRRSLTETGHRSVDRGLGRPGRSGRGHPGRGFPQQPSADRLAREAADSRCLLGSGGVSVGSLPPVPARSLPHQIALKDLRCKGVVARIWS